MSAPREIELKLEVPSHSVARLVRSPLLKGRAAGKPATLVSVYFDTDTHRLRDKGVSLRVRRIGRRHVQTVKLENGASTLFDRAEWERDIPGKDPDLDLARKTGVKALRSKKLRHTLKPVFETRVRRRAYTISNRDSEIAFTIDKGTVEAGRRSSPLCEVELELKRGESAALFRLARTLAEEVPVRLAIQSKSERGYALVEEEEPAAVKAAPVALSPEMSRQTAFQVIARACLHHLVANQPALQVGDAEALHQSRVALRRLRAAISLFADMLGDEQTEEMKTSFRWIGSELAPARELDVFMRRVVKPAADGKPNGPGVAVLTKDLRQRHADAFAHAQATVESARFRDIVLAAACWVEAGDWTTRNGDLARGLRERPIAPAAAEELRRRRKTIQKRAASLATLDPERRHKLRIQAKKLRYASEFFAGVFPARKASERRLAFVARLEHLQDALGDLNDIAVHEGLTERLAEIRDDATREGRTRTAFAAGRLSGREEARMASVLKDADHAAAAFAKAKPFWS